MGANNKFGEVKEIKRGPVIVSGYWTDDSSDKIEGAEMCARDEKNVVVKIGDKVKFHIIVRNIDAGEIVELSLFEKKSGKDKDMSKKYDCTIDGDGHGEVDIQIDGDWNKYYDEETKNYELQVYFKAKYEKKKKSLSALEVFETKIITVLIELPHSGFTDKVNAKGLGGHTGIIVNKDYYDYGPQPGEGTNFYTEGRPWWDWSLNKTSDPKGLSGQDMIDVLDDNMARSDNGIKGRVTLIDILASKKEHDKVQKWWDDKYANLGKYSVWILPGDQCTTTVKKSLSSKTRVFKLNSIIKSPITKGDVMVTQTPKGFLNLLLRRGKHTSGVKKGKPLTITKDYPELP